MTLTMREPGPACTCGAWMSVLPPPPCPVHAAPAYQWVLVPIYPPQPTRWYPVTTTTGTITVSTLPPTTSTLTYTS